MIIGFKIEGIGDGGGFPLESGIPVVFNGVVGATMKQTSNCGPFIAKPGVCSDDGVVFVGGERSVFDVGRELVAPA